MGRSQKGETQLGNPNLFLSRICELRRAMMDDGIRSGVPFRDEDHLLLSERTKAEGSSFIKVTLPLLGKALDRGLIVGRFSCPSNFSLGKGTRLPRFCLSVFKQIFAESGKLLNEPNVLAIHHLRQFLLLDSKLIFQPNAKMRTDVIQEFKNRMSDLRKIRLPVDNPVLLEAKRLLGFVLKGLDLTDIHPGHGPGSVSEKLTRFERWDFPTWPIRAEKEYPHLVYGAPSIRFLMSLGKRIPRVASQPTRICLVPKDFRGPRLISAEGYVNQYLQQGQMKSIMQYIDNHWLISRSVKLRDQTFNRAMAALSYDLDMATLDLSNASDTVSVALVWYLLSEVPKLRRQLFATRSDFARNGDDLIKIAAFAPMGSATCFPIETLVFWSLAMSSLRRVRSSSVGFSVPVSKDTHLNQRTYPSWKEISSSIAVFGDDIVIPKDALDTFTTILSQVGCIVNMSKTCWQTPFRESCGGEWFAGTPITITRNRRYQYEEEHKLVHYPVLLDLQRKFFVSGWEKTAAVLLKWGREISPVFVRTVPPPSANGTEQAYRRAYYQKCPWDNFRIERYLEDCLQGKPRKAASASHVLSESSIRRSGEYSFRSISPVPIDGGRDTTCGDSPFVCAFGRVASHDATLKVRYNQDYQRWEYRIPVEYQHQHGWGTEGWPRLMARLLSDRVERVAERNRKVKFAWRYLPLDLGLSPQVKG